MSINPLGGVILNLWYLMIDVFACSVKLSSFEWYQYTICHQGGVPFCHGEIPHFSEARREMVEYLYRKCNEMLIKLNLYVLEPI